ncbi:MAG TPA: HAMP domain-containing sensor histidine kinase [Bryobacteraceae bacterium]|nr:HAMP domain-containing sensor histidine kinase [Bryobacteraceae bacterium]
MMRPGSIQFRLTAWYALVLAAALGLFSGLTYFALQHRLYADLEESLSATANRFEAYLRREAALDSDSQLRMELDEFCQALPATDYVELVSARGFEFHYPERYRQKMRDVRAVRRQFTVGEDAYTLEAVASARPIRRTLEMLRWLLLSLIPAAVVMACFGGAWLSRRALRPVDEITTAARTIGIENLTHRLPVPDTGDEIQRLTEVWNTMLARLDSAVQTLSQFAADASHELRTPLAVIRTSAELALRRARSPESYRESLREIAAEAERMTQLVEDLLFLARADAKTAGMPMEPLDPREIVREVAMHLRDLAALRKISLATVFPDQPRMVAGNRAALRRLFLVLLDNAIKYSHEGGKINLIVTADEERVTVEVEDFGIGISPEDLPHIFQRFYRADKARSSSGYGLGLSIAATIARVHGAAIDVRSTEGAGSVFAVTFPVRSDQLAAISSKMRTSGTLMSHSG